LKTLWKNSFEIIYQIRAAAIRAFFTDIHYNINTHNFTARTKYQAAIIACLGVLISFTAELTQLFVRIFHSFSQPPSGKNII
jgi:hypothetical protein